MIDLDKVYTSNGSGDFKVVDYKNNTNVLIKFIATGNAKTVAAVNITTGSIKDELHPSVYGVGFLGCGNYVAKINGKHTKQYKVWRSMFLRCYCPSFKKRQPTYAGCKVCDEWHNFQAFAEWFDANYVEGFHLDKDVKVSGNKVYSPLTCKFISQAENNEKSTAKTYRMISPDGKEVDIYNLSKFCKDNGHNDAAMRLVMRGLRGQHHGWTRNIRRELLKR